MDRLEADVSALVEAATSAGEAPVATFGRIHRLAAAAAGLDGEAADVAPSSARAGVRRPT